MIKKHKVKRKDGSVFTQISVVEGYRPFKGAAPKQRTIKDFGYLENQTDLEKFWKEVNECNESLKSNKGKINIELEQKIFDNNYSISKNYGYKIIESIYNFLELDIFFSKVETKSLFPINDIVKFLVINRILNPDSKRSDFQSKDFYYGLKNDFELHDIYRCLSIIDEKSNEIQNHLNEVIKKKIGRNNQLAYYDVTNYYFEIDYSNYESIRQKGVSKEHRTNPIIQLGLFMDSNNLPIKMDIYRGNVSDSLTLKPALLEIKKEYNLKRLIVVADKGINSNKNIDFIIKNGDGYLFSQILKGKKGQRYQEYIFDEKDYIYNVNKTYKYKIIEEEYEYKINNKIEKHKRKVLIYWKKEIAERERKRRENKINKCIKSMTNNAYLLTHEATEYLKFTNYVKKTGDIADGKEVEIDFEKIENEQKYDGYFCLVTSESNMDNKDMHKNYSGLSRIEETFRISKTEILSRPIYLRTNEHIKGHFQICFISILVLRLLENKLKDEISIERMIKSLNSASLIELSRGILHLTYNDVKQSYNETNLKQKLAKDYETIEDFKKIMKEFNIEADNLNLKQEKFKKIFDELKFLP